MNTKKSYNEYANLVSQLTDLADENFHSAIHEAKLFRKAKKAHEKSLLRQKRAALSRKSKNTNKSIIKGVDYEPAF